MTRVAFDDAITAPAIDIPVVTQQISIDQIVQKITEIPQLHCIWWPCCAGRACSTVTGRRRDS